VLNLVANALKFTESGGRVTVVVGPDAAGRPSFAVRDTGAGIAPDQLPRVFDRFYQADRSQADGSLTPARGGTGVGLALAREVVERHGGTITAESVPGSGSTFTVVLPAPGVAEAADAADGDGELERAGPRTRRPHWTRRRPRCGRPGDGARRPARDVDVPGSDDRARRRRQRRRARLRPIGVGAGVPRARGGGRRGRAGAGAHDSART
jgi:hypothetical protein